MSFKSLVCAVSEQCQEIKEAMGFFPYFETWDADVIAECCRVSSRAEFPPNEIILGPGIGDAHTAHFLVKGVCRMVKHLQVEVVTNSRGKVRQKLCKVSDSKMSDPQSKHEGYTSRLFNQKEERPDVSNEETKPEATSDGKQKSEDEEETEEDRENKESKNSVEEAKGIILESDHHLKVLEECKRRRAEAMCFSEVEPPGERPKNVEGVFIECGMLLSGACFGLGKIGKDNLVMSQTSVKILKIPLRFLLQHNPCNIWNRISLFHSLYLFQDEKIFDYFQNDRQWNEKKKKRTREIVSVKNIPNYTCIADAPYSIRLSNNC